MSLCENRALVTRAPSCNDEASHTVTGIWQRESLMIFKLCRPHAAVQYRRFGSVVIQDSGSGYLWKPVKTKKRRRGRRMEA
jgi:hypothetical protein